MQVNLKINFKSMALSVIIILITLELSPYIIAPAILDGGFSRNKIKAELATNTIADTSITKGEENSESYLSEHIVHPYLGFIHNPDEQYNQFGFPSERRALLIESGKFLKIGAVVSGLRSSNTLPIMGIG